jgi:hypothetical protein
MSSNSAACSNSVGCSGTTHYVSGEAEAVRLFGGDAVGQMYKA